MPNRSTLQLPCPTQIPVRTARSLLAQRCLENRQRSGLLPSTMSPMPSIASSHSGAKPLPTKRAKQASKGGTPSDRVLQRFTDGKWIVLKPTGFPPEDFFLSLVTVLTRRSAPYLLPTGRERSTWKPERSCGWWSYIQSK